MPMLANQTSPLNVTVSSTATTLALAWPQYQLNFKNETGLVQVYQLHEQGLLLPLQSTTHLFFADDCTNLGQHMAVDDTHLALTCTVSQQTKLFVAHRYTFTFDTYVEIGLPILSRLVLARSALQLHFIGDTMLFHEPDGCLYYRNASSLPQPSLWTATCGAAVLLPSGVVQPTSTMIMSPTSSFALEHSTGDFVQPVYLHQGVGVRGLRADIHHMQASSIAFNNVTAFVVDLAMQELLLVPLSQLEPTTSTPTSTPSLSTTSSTPTKAAYPGPGGAAAIAIPTHKTTSAHTTDPSTTETTPVDATTAHTATTPTPAVSRQRHQNPLTIVLVAVACSLLAAGIVLFWARQRIQTHRKLLSRLVTGMEEDYEVSAGSCMLVGDVLIDGHDRALVNRWNFSTG
jgi:hypothetical protein